MKLDIKLNHKALSKAEAFGLTDNQAVTLYHNAMTIYNDTKAVFSEKIERAIALAANYNEIIWMIGTIFSAETVHVNNMQRKVQSKIADKIQSKPLHKSRSNSIALPTNNSIH